jgi:hypothetical protein
LVLQRQETRLASTGVSSNGDAGYPVASSLIPIAPPRPAPLYHYNRIPLVEVLRKPLRSGYESSDAFDYAISRWARRHVSAAERDMPYEERTSKSLKYELMARRLNTALAPDAVYIERLRRDDNGEVSSAAPDPVVIKTVASALPSRPQTSWDWKGEKTFLGLKCCFVKSLAAHQPFPPKVVPHDIMKHLCLFLDSCSFLAFARTSLHII